VSSTRAACQPMSTSFPYTTLFRSGVLLDGERDFGAHAAADPVALHELDRLGPVEQVEITEQTVRVRGDAQHPLLERTPEHRMVRSEEHTSELQSPDHLVCRLLLEK